MFSFFKSKPTVSLIRLNGVIGNVGRFSQGMSLASQSDIIKKAFALKNIKAVVISINSPGGSPVQSNLLYDLIRSEAEEKKVKVITYAEDVGASCGYMLM
jgi:ClpP class serine protease